MRVMDSGGGLERESDGDEITQPRRRRHPEYIFWDDYQASLILSQPVYRHRSRSARVSTCLLQAGGECDVEGGVVRTETLQVLD